jgi:type IV pilus assembly protein PilE
MRSSRRQAGFTLIELVVAVLVVGILAAIAYPSYMQYTMRANRGDATRALMYTAQQLERCYSQTFSYVGCANVPYGWIRSNNGYYWVIVSAWAGTPNGWNMWAMPVGPPQSNDAQCGWFFMSSNNFQWSSGTLTPQQCWGTS